MSKVKKVLLIAISSIVLFIAIVVGVLFAVLKHYEDMATYQVDGNVVDSIKTVVGKRTLVGIGKSMDTSGGESKSYSYGKIKSVKEDLTTYVNALKREDFVPKTKADFTKPEGELLLTKEAVDEGEVVTILIIWEKSAYEIEIDVR